MGTNSENMNSLKAEELKSNNQNETEIKTESNKICITSLHINSTETEKNVNEKLITEKKEKKEKKTQK